jgi:hypothetical protein
VYGNSIPNVLVLALSCGSTRPCSFEDLGSDIPGSCVNAVIVAVNQPGISEKSTIY